MVDHVRLGKLLVLSVLRTLRPWSALFRLLTSKGVLLLLHPISSLFSLWFDCSFLNRRSGRLFFGRKFLFILLVVMWLVCNVGLLFSNLSFLLSNCSLLQRMGWLVLICKVLFWVCRGLPSASLLGQGTLVSIMERLSFLQIEAFGLLWLFLILHINVVIIGITSIHLVRHVKSTEVRRNKLPAGNVLFGRHQVGMEFASNILTCLHLSKSFCFFLNSRSRVVCLFSLLSIAHWIRWLILVLLLVLFCNLSVFAFIFSDFGRSFSSLCTSSLSGMSASWFRPCSVSLHVVGNQLLNFWFSHAVKVRIG